MALKFKHIEKNETFRVLKSQFPIYLTDDFEVWHYAVLDAETVLVVSSNSCQVQSFEETFNSKYAVSFDELIPCTAAEFDAVYGSVHDRLARADQAYRASLPVLGRHLTPDFTAPGTVLKAS